MRTPGYTFSGKRKGKGKRRHCALERPGERLSLEYYVATRQTGELIFGVPEDNGAMMLRLDREIRLIKISAQPRSRLFQRHI
jgi:hypothetical protein